MMMNVTAMAAIVPAIAALQDKGEWLASLAWGTMTGSMIVVSVMGDSFARVLTLGAARYLWFYLAPSTAQCCLVFRLCHRGGRCPRWASSGKRPKEKPRRGKRGFSTGWLTAWGSGGLGGGRRTCLMSISRGRSPAGSKSLSNFLRAGPPLQELGNSLYFTIAWGRPAGGDSLGQVTRR
jgi:hypothetical protein